MTQMSTHSTDPQDVFPTDVEGLPDATGSATVRLHDGDTFNLRIFPVRNRIAGNDLRMLGYNGSVRGPTLPNPGLWMGHCHIAEHAQSGMMFSFDVARRPGPDLIIP
jgi:hypothetical protein